VITPISPLVQALFAILRALVGLLRADSGIAATGNPLLLPGKNRTAYNQPIPNKLL